MVTRLNTERTEAAVTAQPTPVPLPRLPKLEDVVRGR